MNPRGEVWEARKRLYYQTHERRCQKCGYKGKASSIHLHHLYYTAPMGREPDHHLMAVCHRCHSGIHALAQEKGIPIYAATAAFQPRARRQARSGLALVVSDDFSHLLPPDL